MQFLFPFILNKIRRKVLDAGSSTTVEQFISRKADLLFAPLWNSAVPVEDDWQEASCGKTPLLPWIIFSTVITAHWTCIWCNCLYYLIYRTLCHHASSWAVYGGFLWGKEGPILQGCRAWGCHNWTNQLYQRLWVFCHLDMHLWWHREGHWGPGADGTFVWLVGDVVWECGFLPDVTHDRFNLPQALCPIRDVPSNGNHDDPLSYYQVGDLIRGVCLCVFSFPKSCMDVI